MREFSRFISLTSLCMAFLFFAAALGFGGQLIEPTRTLEGEEKPMGKLAVFSEPPGLEVMLDETEIGQTPTAFVQVEPGFHKLRIEDTETDIYVAPGKSVQMSFYKGSFIEIPEKKREVEEEKPVETISKKRPQEPSEEKVRYEPFYWPLNPDGPIYPKNN